MAGNDTEIRIKLDAQGNPSIVKVNKSIDKQNKAIDKNTKSKKKNEKQGNRSNAVEKSLYQTSLNSTKGFSKQARSMGGSSGLVAAYATLAANVFAATAAFGALSRAAQFEQLQKGLKELGHQSGQTLSIMAQGLRDVTGGAISAEESMRAAALGVSGGFGGAELEGLAKIAKGASITLGRSLPDAFDRLTRGAIKLEPEILDELGIMVRLDDAVDNYATSIGKTGAQLTQMERRQAFMNAILEQGEAKFGDIADAIEPDVYARLGATFSDLTKNMFSFVNESLRLGKVVGFLADNMIVLSGVMLLFGSTIAGKMLPFLASSAEGSLKAADAAAEYAVATEAAGKAELLRIESSLGKGSATSKPYLALSKGLETSKNKTKTLNDMQKSLNASMRRQQTLVKSTDKLVKKAAKDRIAALKYEQILLKRAIDLEKGKGAAAFASGKAKQVQVFQDAATNEIVSFTNKEQSFTQAWKNIGQGANNYRDEMVGVAEETSKTNAKLGTFGKMQLWMSKTTKALTQRLVLLKAAFLQLLPWIAAAVIVIGTIIAIQRKMFNTEEQKKYSKGLDDMATLFDELSEKTEKYNKALASGKDLAASQINAFKIQSGIITGINEQLKENIRLRDLAAKSRDEETDVGGVMQGDDIQGLRNKRLETTSSMFKQMGEGANINYIMDELQLAEDAFSSLNIENPFEWMKDMDIGTVLNNFQDIEGSLEAEALKELFSKGIPEQADFMMKKLKIAMKKDFNQEEMLAALLGIVQETENAFGPLGPTVEGLAEGFKEAEKEATKYIRSFAKKTSVDDFIATTSSSIKIIDDLKASLKASGMDVESGIGLSLLNVGATLADVLGPGFKDAQRAAKEAGKAMKDANKTRGDGSDEAKAVETTAKALAKYEHNLIAVNKNLKDTQRFEMIRKTLLGGIDKMMKFANKNYKNNVQLAGLENKQLLKKLKLEQKIQESKIKEVKTLFERQKFNVRDAKGRITDQEKQIDFAEFMKKNLTDQLDIVEQSGVGSQNLFALRESMFNQSLRDLDIQKNIDQQQHVALIQRTEAEMKLLKIGKELLDQRQAISRVDQQLDNFRKTGSTGLNAKQEAQFKVNAAREAANFAVNTLDSELAMINARAAIQKVEMEILQKQLDLYNQEARDTHTGPGEAAQIEDLKMEEAFAAIDKLALYEKVKVRQTTELLQKKVPLAAAEGVESIAKAIESGDLFAGIGMGGITDMFKEFKDGKIALKDSPDAATFFKEAMSGNTLPGDAKIEKAILALPDQLAGKNLGVDHNIDASPMGKTTDDFLSKLDLGIDISDIMEQASKSAEEGAEPWKKLPVPLLLELMDRGQVGSGAGWNKAQFEKMVHGSLDSFFLRKETEAYARKLGEGSDVGVVADDPYNISKDKMTRLNDHGFKGPSMDIPDDDAKAAEAAAQAAAEAAAKRAERLRMTREQVTLLSGAMAGLNQHLADFGPEGEAMIAFREGMIGITHAVLDFAEASGPDKMQERLAATAAIIGNMAQMMAADSKGAVARIDQMIDAEKKKDGKSAESLSKIKGMEGKKLAIQKKAFETNKKMKIAETAISTASGAMAAYSGTLQSIPPPWGVPVAIAMAAMVSMMGMKQISMIKKQQFTGGGGVDSGAPASITVGKRGNKVDTAQKASSGELAYLRGERGIGTTANNFQASNGAAGLRKGYADGGVVVGERGPEVIQPTTGYNVVPNDALGGKQVNAHFTIHAVDAAGVEEVLMGQQGHIINMIRSAANENGEEFLESIDTETYGNPQSAGGIDY